MERDWRRAGNWFNMATRGEAGDTSRVQERLKALSEVDFGLPVQQWAFESGFGGKQD